MKMTVSVTGPPVTNANTAQCQAELEVEALDQVAAERLIDTVRQCNAIVLATSNAGPNSAASQSHPTANHSNNDNGHGKRLATDKQVKAIYAMAGRQGVELNTLLPNRFGVSSLSALSIREASSLIDELKNNLANA